jgi:Glycosyl hydrolase family 3 C-terminal domain
LSLTAAPHKVVFEQYAEGPQGFFARPSQLGIFADEQVVDPAARKLAAEADAVVVAAGFDPESESEGADRTFGLPAGQDQLIREMAAANKNTIVVVTSGGAVDTKGWLDSVPALIEAWYPGQSGGIAAPTSCSETSIRPAGCRFPTIGAGKRIQHVKAIIPGAIGKSSTATAFLSGIEDTITMGRSRYFRLGLACLTRNSNTPGLR